MLFKKGDPALCSNYRPISLLAVGYKILAAILLERLKAANAEDRIWSTQYGFKSEVGTGDALFAARRVIDLILASRDTSAILVALDWSKVFDNFSRCNIKSFRTIRNSSKICTDGS